MLSFKFKTIPTYNAKSNFVFQDLIIYPKMPTFEVKTLNVTYAFDFKMKIKCKLKLKSLE